MAVYISVAIRSIYARYASKSLNIRIADADGGGKDGRMNGRLIVKLKVVIQLEQHPL